MKTYRILSLLLGYPKAEWLSHHRELKEALLDERLLPPKQLGNVVALLDSFTVSDLLTLQERYVALFDRGRGLSLHLFEHVHGESRDRGQAMVDLMNLYKSKGFEITAAELPDYLPLFLEFLSVCDPAEARETLGEAVHIVAALAAKLKDRESPYSAVFDAIIALANAKVDTAFVAQAIEEDRRRDESLEALDREWAEAPAFDGAGENACSICPTAQPPRAIAPTAPKPAQEAAR